MMPSIEPSGQEVGRRAASDVPGSRRRLSILVVAAAHPDLLAQLHRAEATVDDGSAIVNGDPLAGRPDDRERLIAYRPNAAVDVLQRTIEQGVRPGYHNRQTIVASS